MAPSSLTTEITCDHGSVRMFVNPKGVQFSAWDSLEGRYKPLSPGDVPQVARDVADAIRGAVWPGR